MKKKETTNPKFESGGNHADHYQLFLKTRTRFSEVRNLPGPTKGSVDPERLKLMGR